MIDPADILIIGGGPAGLSAATSIVRQCHTAIIFDSRSYRSESPFMHTVPTWDHRNPEDFRAAARKDLERYGTVTVENAEIVMIEKKEDGMFKVKDDDGKTWVGRKVILATGVKDVFPNIPGYAECWISGIFHCLYCHGWEVRGLSSSGMLAEGDTGSTLTALHLARMNLRFSSKVTLYTNGNDPLASDIEAALAKSSTAPMEVEPRQIAKFEKGAKTAEVVVHFVDGTSKLEGFISHKPQTVLKGVLHEQLGLELTPKGVIQVNPLGGTSVKGVFAAGDIAQPFTQAVGTAISSGTAAGAGAPLQVQAETWGQQPLF
ncbi:hypothetical protein BDV96DRAFT_491828 [Lophiotrema nucula]|uniref:FAD/NAD(P)-binding domain-containing protein n=1 Tax=Lophiotrema nucula TaxID=690887 RepID=A0A6A5ZAW6_9PLEO|nr:hypothetical protein BDV96DRAFT_491828 [Lophiotrema nucula]